MYTSIFLYTAKSQDSACTCGFVSCCKQLALAFAPKSPGDRLPPALLSTQPMLCDVPITKRRGSKGGEAK